MTDSTSSLPFPTPESLQLFERFPARELRSYFRTLVYDGYQSVLFLEEAIGWSDYQQEGLIHLPRHQKLLERYYHVQALSETLIMLNPLDRDVLGPNNQHTLLYHLMRADLERVTLPTALTAWLTTDEFRWHAHNPLVPPDLNYGLCTYYPNSVCQYGAFVAGYVSLFYNKLPSLYPHFQMLIQASATYLNELASSLPEDYRQACIDNARMSALEQLRQTAVTSTTAPY